jgi:hypothetical protein
MIAYFLEEFRIVPKFHKRPGGRKALAPVGKSLGIKGDRLRSIRQSLVDITARGKTAGKVRKPQPSGGLWPRFLYDRNEVACHRCASIRRPAGLFINGMDQAFPQVLLGMRQNDNRSIARVSEDVVRALDSFQEPAFSFKPPSDLPA